MKLRNTALNRIRTGQKPAADQKEPASIPIPPPSTFSILMVQPSNHLTPLYTERIRGLLNGEPGRTPFHDYIPTSKTYPASFASVLSQFNEEERRLYEEVSNRPSVPPKDQSQTIDLAAYASKATLPSMPWIPRQQQFSTIREPNNIRNLRSLHVIPEEEFNRRVLSYVKERPSSSSALSSQMGELRVPHPEYPSVGTAGVRMPKSEKRVQTWVELVALQTALCLLKSAEPELEDLDFDEVTGKGMRKALSDVVFERGSTADERLMALLVEVKCPWTLPYSELIKITELTTGLRRRDQATDTSLQPPDDNSEEGGEGSRQQNETNNSKGKSKSKGNADTYSPGPQVLRLQEGGFADSRLTQLNARWHKYTTIAKSKDTAFGSSQR
ncbi:hypothetical protein FRC01_005088 [Tulasnella sp. 417]|nr:hypothetical protein FRC01_005088 [Tulasnella sp. 417]